MTKQDMHRHDTLKHVRDFGAAHTADFPADSLGAKKLAEVAAGAALLDQHAAAQQTGAGAARSGTSNKAVCYALLRDELAVINHAAHALALEIPGLDEKFRLPRGTGNEALLAAARAFRADATPLKDQFLALELPANFLEHLDADIAAFETAKSTQHDGTTGRVSATAEMDATLHTAFKAVRVLDVIVRNKYRDNPAVLAAWTTASHTVRAPHTPKPEPTPPPAPPAA